MIDRVSINGDNQVADCLDERAFQFGDGLFETIAIVQGQPCLWEAHMARLLLGCERLHLSPPDLSGLADQALQYCRDLERAVLKIYWTAGRSVRGYGRPSDTQEQWAMRVADWPPMDAGDGWSLRLCQHRWSENPVLARIKHLNRLDQVLARAEWGASVGTEGLMLGQDGRVVSGTMSNLIIQNGDSLASPMLNGAGIAGVVRDLAIRLSTEMSRRFHSKNLSVADLKHADALYLTNSLIGVVRVADFEGVEFDSSVPVDPVMLAVEAQCHLPSSPLRNQ